MYSLQTQRQIEGMAQMFNLGPGAFICDSYGTRGLSMQERHELFGSQRRQIREPKLTRENPGLMTGILEIDLETNDMRIYSASECALYEHQKTGDVDWKPISSSPEEEGWLRIASPINGRPGKVA
ncbi:MAG: hypothetical protein KKF56_01200 [Nanoarchaeota archaeon]|nr:hypothetical protein [Nanoarchaeota archaeon]